MDKFAQTLLANGTPTDSPIGNFPALRSFYNSSFQLPAASRSVGAGTIAAQVAAGNAKQASDAARSEQINSLADQAKVIKQKMDDQANGRNYQQLPKNDGGYDFKDALGNPISVYQYAKATGADPVSVLKGSNNPLDVQYVHDFQKVQAVTDALHNNDTNALQKLGVQIYGDNSKAPEDPVNKAAITKIMALKKANPYDVYKAFMDFYPHVYGQTSSPVNNAESLRAPNTLPGITINGRP